MSWQDLFVALALMLVIEGILPFMSPARMRQAGWLISQMDDRSLRLSGSVCMVAGVTLLYLLR
ncbi:MAG TPA: DUF2065 domain-containing protein [Gammaproteobacteria bacterium]|nr:DUF2065 domain-containing protein [Gammaproteobacteria bacterium]